MTGGPHLIEPGPGERGAPLTGAARRRVLVEVFALWLVTLLGIRAVVALQSLGLPDWTLAAVPFLFIYAPVGLCAWRGVDSFAYRLALPALSDRAAWREGLTVGLLGAVLLLLPWLPAYHAFQNVVHWALHAMRTGEWSFELTDLWMRTSPRWRVPREAWLLVPYHLFFVAIPEELFYRGYLQTRLNEVWPRRYVAFGAAWGPGLLLATAMFAFGHSLVAFQWWHFATFFPGLVFAWMRERTGQPLAGAVFHMACNVIVVWMDTFYGIRPAA